jgi:hypothetical protein
VTMKKAVFWDVTPCVAFVTTGVLEGCITSIIRVKRISELGTSGVTSNRSN